MNSDVTPQREPRFCHQCGGDLRLRRVPGDERERLVCQTCAFIHYENPRVVASVLPERHEDGKHFVLLMRRAMEPRRGSWSPPGGFVELGESPEEAAVREGAEEVSMTLEPFALLGVYSRPALGIVVVAYRARALERDAQPGIEALEARWFAADEIPWDELAFETTTKALRDWLAAIEG